MSKPDRDKRCTQCKTVKPESEFLKFSDRSVGVTKCNDRANMRRWATWVNTDPARVGRDEE